MQQRPSLALTLMLTLTLTRRQRDGRVAVRRSDERNGVIVAARCDWRQCYQLRRKRRSAGGGVA